ncbi:MAG: hypothetical protein E6H51_16895 [Betaproteobacteria bacterium]|nr:MAG: hypothetical protein E6H51_16895 [Betaproteobacteria bacterium]
MSTVRSTPTAQLPDAGASEHLGILGIVGDTCFLTVVGRPRNGRQIGPWRGSGNIRRRRGKQRRAIRRVAHFQPKLGDDLRVRHVGDVDDLRITESGRPPGTRGRPTARAARAARLVGADEVRMPIDAHGDHRLGLPLVCPEELADDPDLRIGATELIVARVLDHQSVRTERGIRWRRAELAGLPREQQRPFGHAGQEAIPVEE